MHDSAKEKHIFFEYVHLFVASMYGWIVQLFVTYMFVFVLFNRVHTCYH